MTNSQQLRAIKEMETMAEKIIEKDMKLLKMLAKY